MIVSLVRRRRWFPLATLTGLATVHGAMEVGLLPCPASSPPQCLLASAALVAVASAAAFVARAGYLALRTYRAVAALPRIPTPPHVLQAASRAGLREIECIDGQGTVAFCAGLFRPRVYLVPSTAGPELDAILAHEGAHARHRDPLRRLLARAAADVLFYLPLCSWWARRHMQRTELSADRAAIERVGRRAVAAALFSADSAQVPWPVAAFDGAIHARAAQLLGDDIPEQRPSRARVQASVTGLAILIGLTTCVAGVFWSAIGLA